MGSGRVEGSEGGQVFQYGNRDTAMDRLAMRSIRKIRYRAFDALANRAESDDVRVEVDGGSGG